MNYYPFHLGDYASHTLHLDPFEDIAYRRMLDAYYLREGPLPSSVEEVARLIRMKQNMAEVQSVLNEFFSLTSEGWRHSRCDDELLRMKDKQAKARASAQASVNARSANAQRTLNERSTDVQLPTPTPTPTPKEKEKETAPRKRVAPPGGVSDSVWQDFLTVRRAKKAPMTDAALDGIKREAEKAGWTLEDALKECCARGWQGFKADWVAEKPKPVAVTDVVRVTVPAKQGPDPALQKIISDQLKAVPPSPAIRAKMEALRVSPNTPHPRTGTE